MPPVLEEIQCPACGADCKLSFTVCDKENTDWVFCGCSTIFRLGKPDKAHFDAEYLKKYTDYKALAERYDYFLRLYLPLVRELTYGRRFLDVGFGADYQIKALEQDGWIVDGIDLMENEYTTGDFEKHDFTGRQYDFVLMGRVLEAFHNPMRCLLKAKEILSPGGVLAITTPDAELVYERGLFGFGNWDPQDKWVIFGETQLRKVLETMGYKVVLSRKDTEKRGVGWNTMHIIAQRVI